MNNVMQLLFQSFEKESIPYLHFKSNTNLCESLSNKADFDVLVDKTRLSDVERIITSNNGKRHNPFHIGKYPGVDNWLVFDNNNGEIYHLHLHYQLATGKFLVKDYILPWNELLFSTRVRDTESGIYVTDPNLELIMLATRSVLKAKPFDYLKKIIGLYSMSTSMKKEWDDLYAKSSTGKLSQYVNNLYPNNSEKIFSILSKEHLTCGDYRHLHIIVRNEMKINRRLSPVVSAIKSFIYRIEDLYHKFNSRKLDGTPIVKKVSLQGGLIVAFIGVDGAGKSTISNEIAKWIGRKIECKRFYMGTGDGKTTLFASALKFAKGQMFRKPSSLGEKAENDINEQTLSKISITHSPLLYISKMMKMRLIASVERNNCKKLKKCIDINSMEASVFWIDSRRLR